ncbi:gfo/Idh/MocA family oxidoreductase [Leptospira yanagawae]|uniref:Gfo/Idh/MocA family oxidoreductase n=1 Tax=Leptospira yanagawae TaxID=293069 RepID=A0ABY2M2F1_9LEPT|nr:Gfo/Idh/MocA family oxidoreductase [Leptospira yanagawae]TGL18761.1 gfo/Idh/MocA family oxidoreductase [Leptospira yanagawae]
MKPRKINVILIGLGRIASKLEKDPYRKKPCTHMGVISSHWGKKNFNFVSGYDTKSDVCDEFANTWKVKTNQLPTELPSGFEFPKVDLAIVATPSPTHPFLAKQCMESGIKHILIEKPVAMDAKQAKSLEKMAKAKGCKLWINHERRYHPSYLFVKKELEKGSFGDLKSIRASVFTSAKNPGIAFSKFGGGPLLHDGTHAVDLIHWLVGKPKLIHSSLERPKKGIVETRAFANFRTQNQVEISLDVSGGRDYFQFELDLHTDSHRIICSNDGFQFFQAMPSRLYKGFHSLKSFVPKGFPKPEVSNAFLGIYSEIVSVIQGESEHMEGTIGDNVQILESIESIYRFSK